MPSSITANLSYPNLVLWRVFNQGSTVGFTVSGSVITLVSGTHPFSTGDTVYYSEALGSWVIRYAITTNNTQLSLATSYANATAATPIPTSVGVFNTGFANIPTIYYPSLGVNINLLTNPLAAYSKSAQSFAISDNVSIEFTVPRWGSGNVYFDVSYWTFGLISDVGDYKLGLIDFLQFSYGDSVSGVTINNTYRNDNTSKSSLTFTFRILLQNKQASIQVKTTTNTYITLFTSSTLSTSIQGLRFFASFPLNGLAFTNCTITYL
jgi:hypothetical protein